MKLPRSAIGDDIFAARVGVLKLSVCLSTTIDMIVQESKVTWNGCRMPKVAHIVRSQSDWRHDVVKRDHYVIAASTRQHRFDERIRQSITPYFIRGTSYVDDPLQDFPRINYLEFNSGVGHS